MGAKIIEEGIDKFPYVIKSVGTHFVDVTCVGLELPSPLSRLPGKKDTTFSKCIVATCEKQKVFPSSVDVNCLRETERRNSSCNKRATIKSLLY